MTGKHLSRRTVLRGLGTTIALPLLDSMVPAFAASRRLVEKAPRRMAFVYIPNGAIMEDWTPEKTGARYDFKPILQPLKPFRDNMSVLSGLAQHNGKALGDGAGDHARAAATFLTGVHPKKTDGADILAGISVDQVAARRVGHKTRFASLELGTEPGRLAGNCDSGYSCAYSNSISWRSPTTPNPPEINPRLVFERLFGDIRSGETPKVRARRLRQDGSILDFVQEDAKKLQLTLGATDQRKLDEYLEGIRDIERRITLDENQSVQLPPDLEKPAGIPAEFTDHIKILFDLMTVALQTDMTRIVTFMIGREGSNRTYREIGVPDPHHGLTHHQDEQAKIDKISKINRFHAEQFAYLLGKMRSVPDGDGTLLDNSMIVYGSSLGDGNRHTHHDLPVLLAGRAGGTVKAGRHLVYPENTPLNNLFLSMLDRVNIPTETLGDSSGKLEQLSGL
jgi:hypothetical protein